VDDRLPDIAAVARRFVSADGWDIWVGRTAGDNDLLSLRLAAAGDWWLHAGDVPGSHVIFRPPAPGGAPRPAPEGPAAREDGGAAPPRATLLDAAHLAAHFSKARAASRVKITWTRARHVGKPRGAPPGQVSLSRRQELWLRVDRARTARLLGQAAPAAGGA